MITLSVGPRGEYSRVGWAGPDRWLSGRGRPRMPQRRAGHALIQQHGEAAAIEAAFRADAMLDKGDLDGAAVWRQIVAAVNEIQREEPAVGERHH